MSEHLRIVGRFKARRGTFLRTADGGWLAWYQRLGLIDGLRYGHPNEAPGACSCPLTSDERAVVLEQLPPLYDGAPEVILADLDDLEEWQRIAVLEAADWRDEQIEGRPLSW